MHACRQAEAHTKEENTNQIAVNQAHGRTTAIYKGVHLSDYIDIHRRHQMDGRMDGWTDGRRGPRIRTYERGERVQKQLLQAGRQAGRQTGRETETERQREGPCYITYVYMHIHRKIRSTEPQQTAL